MKDHCFDLHHGRHCGKHTHSSDICFMLKKPPREKIHYGWIASWLWSPTVRKIYQSYHRIHSRVMTHLAIENFLLLTLFLTRGEWWLTVRNKRARTSEWEKAIMYQIQSLDLDPSSHTHSFIQSQSHDHPFSRRHHLLLDFLGCSKNCKDSRVCGHP